ncbi:MAG: hypothetical protein ACRDSH_15995 [Pseudonocardiaceae bacterium]
MMRRGNDADGITLHAEAGQGYGTKMMWALVIHTPILYYVLGTSNGAVVSVGGRHTRSG